MSWFCLRNGHCYVPKKLMSARHCLLCWKLTDGEDGTAA